MSNELGRPPDPIHRLEIARDYVVETVIVGGVFAAGVALLSTGASSWPYLTAVGIGAALIIVSISLLLIIRIKAIASPVVFKPIMFEHKITHELISADDYIFSRDAAQALKETLMHRPDVLINWFGESGDVEKDKIRGQLVECLAVRVIALHLKKYFSELNVLSKYVTEISYNDLKGLTEANPFLAVTAKSPDVITVPEGGELELVAMVTPEDSWWERFTIVLPKGSKIGYTDDCLTISNKYITVGLHTGSVSPPQNIPAKGQHLKDPRRELIRNARMTRMSYVISVRMSPSLVASRSARRLQGWVDALIKTLNEYFFFASIDEDFAWLSAESVTNEHSGYSFSCLPWGMKTEDEVRREAIDGEVPWLASLILQIRKGEGGQTNLNKEINDYTTNLRQFGHAKYAYDIDALAKASDNSIPPQDKKLTGQLINTILDLERDDQLRQVTAEILEWARRQNNET